jgi:hypothetical protein
MRFRGRRIRRRHWLARLFMTAIQKFLMTVLPKGLAAEIRAESERWQIRCGTCGNARSVWEAGGLRWKAASVGKRIMAVCPQCGVMRSSSLEFDKGPTGVGEFWLDKRIGGLV